MGRNGNLITASLEPYMLRLYPLLEKTRRGDSLSSEEIERASGTNFDRIVEKIRKWFLRRGIRASRRGETIYLFTAEEQAVQRPLSDFDAIRRKAGRTAIMIGGVAATELDTQKQRDIQEHHAAVAAALHAHAVGAAADARFLVSGRRNTERLGK